MNLELFGFSVQQIASYAGAALLAAVGGFEGFKFVKPSVARIFSKTGKATGANGEPGVPEIADYLFRSAAYAKGCGNKALSEAAITGFRELMKISESQ